MAKEFLKICKEDGALLAWILMIFSMCLIIAAFVLPPMAIIDGSVLIAVAELNIFYVLMFKLPNIIASIEHGKALRIKYKDAEIEVNGRDGEDERHPEKL